MTRARRERRLAAVEAKADAVPPGTDRFEGLSYEDTVALRAKLVAEIAAQLRREGHDANWWIAEVEAEGGSVSDQLADDLNALFSPRTPEPPTDMSEQEARDLAQAALTKRLGEHALWREHIKKVNAPAANVAYREGCTSEFLAALKQRILDELKKEESVVH